MPYSILMEIALQTCGILTSWNKAPLTLAVKEGFNLLFRNLDATATLLRAVDLRGQTIQNVSSCTGYSMLGQMGGAGGATAPSAMRIVRMLFSPLSTGQPTCSVRASTRRRWL